MTSQKEELHVDLAENQKQNNMKKAISFLALALFMMSCEKEPAGISFDEFVIGSWTALESQTTTRLTLSEDGTYVLEQQYLNDINSYPENTYVTDKIGEFNFLVFTNFSGYDGKSRMKIIWDVNEDLDVMLWDRGENIAPLIFHRVIGTI